MSFPAFRCLHPKRAVALLGHQASGETTLRRYRHISTLKQAGLGVWGMRQHGESTLSCERPPPPIGAQKEKIFRGEEPLASLKDCFHRVEMMLCCQPTSTRISKGIFTRVGSCLRSLVSLDYSQYHRYYYLFSWSPSPLEGLGLVVNPDARGGRHTSSARTARFGVPPSRVARRRPGRRRCRFPLFAACTRSALWRS